MAPMQQNLVLWQEHEQLSGEISETRAALELAQANSNCCRVRAEEGFSITPLRALPTRRMVPGERRHPVTFAPKMVLDKSRTTLRFEPMMNSGVSSKRKP